MILTEEHHNIRKTVRDFAEREVKPQARELDEKAEFSIPLTKRIILNTTIIDILTADGTTNSRPKNCRI